MIIDILNFLTPGKDPLQVIFFTLIVLCSLGSVCWVTAKARPKSWERIWQGGAGQDEGALEIEHGSVEELSQAVASSAEKVAVILPGMLLVLGLLGTFLGLGLALDHASSILQKSGGTSVGAMGNAMQDLTSMMQGLGTKFKTSTWGIIAFILLKIWESINGFEARRLAWCIGKMKSELASARQRQAAQQHAQEELLRQLQKATSDTLSDVSIKQAQFLAAATAEQTNFLRTSLDANTQTLVTAMSSVWANQTEELKRLHSMQESHWDNRLTALGERLDSLGRSQTEQHHERLNSLQALLTSAQNRETAQANFARDSQACQQAAFAELNQRLDEQQGIATRCESSLAAIVTASQASEQVLSDFTCTSRDNLNALKNAGMTMGSAAKQVGHSAKELAAVVNELNTQMTTVMSDVKEGLGETLATLNADFSHNLKQMGDQSEAATSNLVDVMHIVKSDLGETIANLNSNFSRNLNQMGEQLEAANSKLAQVMEAIKADLGGTINAMDEGFRCNLIQMGSQLERATGELSDVMNLVKTDLSGTIRGMSEDFNRSLLVMTDNLGDATCNISKAIDSMSITVNSAMENVAGNMKSTAEAQKKTTREFEQVSESLNTNILAMTSLVDKLSADIKGGLRAVSESGQRMVSLDKRYAGVSEALEAVPVAVELLTRQNGKPAVDLRMVEACLEQIQLQAQHIYEKLQMRSALEV